MVRTADNRSPREAVEFLLQLLKYNDNNGNPYSDVFWLNTLVQSIGELEFSKQSLSFLPSLLKCIDRLLQFDSLMPSYGSILTINCLHTLVQVALKMKDSVRIDRVCELIKPFRNVERSSWKVRIESSKALLDLEYNCKGLEAAICLFTKFIVEEPSLRGQTKLAVHLMQLCQIQSKSGCENLVSCSTLVALLRLLASKKAFNNVFFRHYLFCILQIIAGRSPTLHGFTKAVGNPATVVESFDEQPTKSASLKLKIARVQEVLSDTPNHSVDAPLVLEATKEADTISNRSEGRMNILKIRVKPPASSSKPGGVNPLPYQSRAAPTDADLGQSSSVSVDAPVKGAFELPCAGNQNVEEVNSSCGHEPHTQLANKNEATANSSNALGDGLSPASSRRDEGVFVQRSSCEQSVSTSKPDEVPPLTNHLDGKRKRKKEKDKEGRKKHVDKDGERRHYDDLEYSERKRRKNERKQMEKMMKLREEESRTSAAELQVTRNPSESAGYASVRDLKMLQASSVSVSKPAEAGTETILANKVTKIKIKIRTKV
ncbi:hypothetical protein KSP40_PGU002944 [Platanthera guangdongensis]|uniref:Transcription initiation factor TFIID subunit 2 TPR repeats domain-containing protein n=1 Tax=Platanthera guangdongensis TaxID=2320717 RepID=A0ABR2M4Y4_9ASPA